MNRFLFACLLALSACGYHFDGGDPITVSVPYVIGDFEGELTDALASALSHTAAFRYTDGQGNWTLKAKILDATNDRIGYRYDRKPKKPKEGEEKLPDNSCEEKLRDNVIGIENRKTISVEISIVDSATGKQILGPQIVKAGADYDYDNPQSCQDLEVTNPATGFSTSTIDFSLGQLDSVGSAGENAIYPIYNRLAQRIVDGMIASGGWDDE